MTDGNLAISSNVEITDNVSRSADCTCTFAALCMQSTEEPANDIHLGLPEEIQNVLIILTMLTYIHPVHPWHN